MRLGKKVQKMLHGRWCDFYVFDLDQLIAALGPDHLVSDIPQLACEACGGAMEIKLAFLPPEPEGEA
jgi:hypothetical protein